LDAADYIGHANYGHRIVEAKQSIREACDELDKALRAAATPSAEGAEVSVEATTRLADAMWQLLDDMGASGQSVCLAAKAEARIAYEPFRNKSEDFKDWMSLEAAQRILKESEQ
jgi:hypothetical protein